MLPAILNCLEEWPNRARFCAIQFLADHRIAIFDGITAAPVGGACADIRAELIALARGADHAGILVDRLQPIFWTAPLHDAFVFVVEQHLRTTQPRMN
ncbi:MAG: hypothetical protein H7144_03425 [Burkholderiales bacterium]|nr:hypothetical protein [Phycisphaerae bacterium]